MKVITEAHIYTEAQFGACLIECGPHQRVMGGPEPDLGKNPRAWSSFSAYYNRVFSYFHEHVRTVNHDPHGEQWVEFWHQYMTWVGDPADRALPGNSIHVCRHGYGRHHS